MTNFTREINRLLLAILIAFGAIVLAATYYGLVGAVTLLPRDDNPRLVEAQQSVLRGNIYDRHNQLMATSSADSDGFALREYLHPEMNSALGYYSFRYGAGGAESAYDTYLSGQRLPFTLQQHLLRTPVYGEDIQLTFNLRVQQQLVDAMKDMQGAAVVMTVPDGEILALVSLPTFDPNSLDVDWETLIEAPGNPFFNRVLQGRYQPGTLMQLPMMISAIVQGQPLNAQFASGSNPAILDDLSIECVVQPENRNITLRQAYLYGCPTPFAQITSVIGMNNLTYTLDLLRLDNTQTLNGFVVEEQEENIENIETTIITRTNLRENVLGQGEYNISPMAVAAMTAAIINEGNAPQPTAIRATRTHTDEQWYDAQPNLPTLAYTTAPTARRIAELMRVSADEGTASLVDWDEMEVGGQAAIAYSGEGTHVWFTGFVILESEQNAVVTIVLENTSDPVKAVEVGQIALEAVRTSQLTTSDN